MSPTFFVTAEFMPRPGSGQQRFDNQHIGDWVHFPPSPQMNLLPRIRGAFFISEVIRKDIAKTMFNCGSGTAPIDGLLKYMRLKFAGLISEAHAPVLIPSFGRKHSSSHVFSFGAA